MSDRVFDEKNCLSNKSSWEQFKCLVRIYDFGAAFRVAFRAILKKFEK